jgi:hypothetical protein
MLTNFNTTHVDLTPTLLTAPFVAGRTLFDAVAVNIEGSHRVNSRRGRISQVVVVDGSDQAVPFDLYFFTSDVAFGTAGAVPTIADAAALSFIGKVSISDYLDLGGVSVARASFDAIEFETLGQDLYVAAVTLGAPTYSASALRIRVAVQLENVARV